MRIVDPVLETVKVYREAGGGFGPPELRAESGDVLRTLLLPGLDLALAEIFE